MVSLVVSVAMYMLLVFLGQGGMIYILLAFSVVLAIRGYYVGIIRINGIRVSERQFPEIYDLAQDLSAKMGVTPMPAIYVLQKGGLLNAMATMCSGVHYIVLYSDMVEVYYEGGRDAFSFILAHELAHVKHQHIQWRMVFTPSLLILAGGYMRAAELTCDRYGAHFCPEGAKEGILLLTAGKSLYKITDTEELIKQAMAEKNKLWSSVAASIISHPPLTQRLVEIKKYLDSRAEEDKAK